MPAYTKLLWRITGPIPRTVGPAPPTGKIWVLRDVLLRNETASASRVFLADGSGMIIVERMFPAGGPSSLQWTGRQVIPTGEPLIGYSDQNASIRVTGYELGV